MPIKKNLQDMPTAKEVERSVDGWMPDAPDLVEPIAQAWYQDYLKNEEHPVDLQMAVEGAEFRASWGGMCLRRIQYHRMEAGASNPPSMADGYRFYLGHDMHDRMQAVAKVVLGEVEIEAALPFAVSADAFGACHIDLVTSDGEFVRPVEVKTIGGYAFKLCATSFRGPAQGPKFNVRRQLALETLALLEAGFEVQRGTVLYLSQELVSDKLALEICDEPEIGRFAAQWDVPVETLIEWAYEQRAEFRLVLDAEKKKELVPRVIPEYGPDSVVVDQRRQICDVIEDGLIVNTESAWMCGFCPFLELCVSHGDIVDVSEVGDDGK